MSSFFQKFAWFEKILELVAYLVGLVSAGSILAILYNSMNEKRREIAISFSRGAACHIIFHGSLSVDGHRSSGYTTFLFYILFALIVIIAQTRRCCTVIVSIDLYLYGFLEVCLHWLFSAGCFLRSLPIKLKFLVT